jgi:hypothetical protein
MIRFIERHWKIPEGQIRFPRRSDLAFVSIDHGHVPRVWHIDENSTAVVFQCERFRMSGEFDRADLFAIRRIYRGDASAAKADVNPFRRVVISNVVGIVFEIQFANA